MVIKQGDKVKVKAKVISLDTPVIPKGFVVFKNGNVEIGRVKLNSRGEAELEVSDLNPGNNNIIAEYDGQGRFNTSVSSIVIENVVSRTPISTSISLISSNFSINYGEFVNFTATVLSADGSIPQGRVKFYSNNLEIKEVELNNLGVANSGDVFLEGGLYEVKAYYVGNDFYGPSITLPISQLISPISTTVNLTSNLNPAGNNQLVNFSAQVSSSYGIPQGRVSFYDGYTTLLATGTLDGSGTVVFTTKIADIGTHYITAVYLGSRNHLTNTSNILSQVITDPVYTPVSMTLTASPTSSYYNQLITLNATLTSTSVPDGIVDFYDGYYTFLGSGYLSDGYTELSISSLSTGSHYLRAIYRGTEVFETKTATLNYTVSKAGVYLDFSIPGSNPSGYGSNIYLLCKVSGDYGSVPSGSINFYDGYYLIGSAILSNIDGVATASISGYDFNAGTHLFTAIYSGDSNHNGLSQELYHDIYKSVSTILLYQTLGTNPSELGDTLTFSAYVVGSVATPTGDVIFFKDGYDALYSGTLSSGQLNYNPVFLSAGTYYLSAIYYGDNNYLPAYSSTLVHQVIGYGTSITIEKAIADPNPSVVGETINYIATVSSIYGTPTGNVQFKKNGTVVATSSLLAGIGNGSITFFGAGTFNITASYLGDGIFGPKTSDPIVQTVNKANTSVSLSASPGVGCAGSNTTYTADVSVNFPGSGTPSGTVIFKYAPRVGTPEITIGSATLVPSVGGATCNISNSIVPAGTWRIKAYYQGDSNYNTSNDTITEYQVNSPTSTTTTLTIDPMFISIHGTTTFTAYVSGGSPDGTVDFYYQQLTIGGDPAGPEVFISSATLVASYASITVSPWDYDVGIFTIRAVYNPTNCYSSSQGTNTLTVS